MTCNCFHKTTALTASETAVNMTMTNPNNISSLDDFNFILCQNLSGVVTGAPLPLTVTINGSTAQVYNMYHLPIYSNRLQTRKPYYATYVNNGTDAWLEVHNTPTCKRFATP